MKKNNWFVPGLISVGIALIFFSIWSPQNKLQLGFSKKNLAKIIEKSGSVKIQNSEMPAAIEIKAQQRIEAREVLQTDTNSEAVVEFNTGGQFRLTEKTDVLIDALESGAPLVVIRTGEIYIEKFGKSSFWVRKDGQIYNAVDFALADKKNLGRPNVTIPDQQNNDQISQIEIESTLNSKKNDFFKCYGQLIQRYPQASGQVLISFTIENQGHTSKIEISRSDISDLSFKSCLKEVVVRTRFRSVSGNPITTVFPLKFE